MGEGREIPLRRLRLRRPDASLGDRVRLVGHRWRMLLRLSVATSISYLVATEVLGHEQAFFAPVAAVIVLTAGAGLRGRTVVELMLGVALGVLVGELLLMTIGRGVWQMALIVVLTVAAGILIGLKGLALTQAASSSVLLTTVLPVAGGGDPAVTRFLDALVGGLCGLALVLLLPRNPVRDIDTEVQRLLRQLASVLRGASRALVERDAGVAQTALERARGMQPGLQALESTAANVTEIARMSPMRWKQREHLDRYVGAVRDLDNAIRDSRVLARRVAAMLRHGEIASPDLAVAIESLAEAVDIFADDLSEDADFAEARQQLVDAARIAVLALPGAMTLNTAAITAQVRSLAADLLYASGSTRDEIDEKLDFD